MLGPSHALSGAAVWLAGSYAAEQFGHFHQTSVQLAIGTAMCAGGALVPDLDMSGRVITHQGGATVAHTFGTVSLFVAEVVEKVSLGIYDLTKTRRDPRRHNGHRTFTHTVLFNVAVGYGVFWSCLRYGKVAVLTTLFLTFAMALRGLFPGWSKRAGWLLTTGCAAGGTYWANAHLHGGRGYPVLGIALGVGGLVHLLGDMLTSHGCPAFWPIPIRGQEWHCVGLPAPIAVTVGGKVEVYGLRTLFVATSIAAVGGMSGPWVYDHVVRLTG